MNRLTRIVGQFFDDFNRGLVAGWDWLVDYDHVVYVVLVATLTLLLLVAR